MSRNLLTPRANLDERSHDGTNRPSAIDGNYENKSVNVPNI